MWYFRALAFDLDGTLIEGDRLDGGVLAALRLARRDRRLILVTGRIHDDLIRSFPGLTSEFDAVVTENGGVLRTGTARRLLAEPVDGLLTRALSRRSVPVTKGEALLAIRGTDVPAVTEEITRLGLDHQVVHNRGEAMVLPAGVTKGTGLRSALAEFGLSAHNTVAVGDAENDIALLQTAEVGVCVANAVKSLSAHADLQLEQADGVGVTTLLHSPLLAGEQRLCPARRWIVAGAEASGRPVAVPGSQAGILIAGETGSGKSYLAGLLAERWIEAGYSVLVIDPEGDHVGLTHRAQVLHVDGAAHLPEPVDLLALTRPGLASLVLDLSDVEQTVKVGYLERLSAALTAERMRYGTPHWVVVDEAHLSLFGRDTPSGPLDAGTCLVTWQPQLLPARIRDTVDITLTAVAAPAAGLGVGGTGGQVVIEARGAEPARTFVPARRVNPHVRHQHKYAAVGLPGHRRFYFRGAGADPEGVGTIDDFSRFLRHCDQETVAYHLDRGDFSRWITDTLGDHQLGLLLAGVERELRQRRAADLEHARERIVGLADTRYLDRPPPPSAGTGR
jgi:hydroxymethylpyrimidine pyrophosphatase-like HAD family hydrolase